MFLLWRNAFVRFLLYLFSGFILIQVISLFLSLSVPPVLHLQIPLTLINQEGVRMGASLPAVLLLQCTYLGFTFKTFFSKSLQDVVLEI